MARSRNNIYGQIVCTVNALVFEWLVLVIKSICNNFELSWWTFSGAKQWEKCKMSKAERVRYVFECLRVKSLQKIFPNECNTTTFMITLCKSTILNEVVKFGKEIGTVAFSHFSWVIFRDDFITDSWTCWSKPSFYTTSMMDLSLANQNHFMQIHK